MNEGDILWCMVVGGKVSVGVNDHDILWCMGVTGKVSVGVWMWVDTVKMGM